MNICRYNIYIHTIYHQIEPKSHQIILNPNSFPYTTVYTILHTHTPSSYHTHIWTLLHLHIIKIHMSSILIQAVLQYEHHLAGSGVWLNELLVLEHVHEHCLYVQWGVYP